MRLLKLVAITAAVTTVWVSAAKAQGPRDPVTEATRFDVSLGYQYIDANSPPGGCQCFGMNGGYISAGLHLNRWLDIDGQVTGTHASNISILGQDLTLMSYMAGPKVSYRYRRLVPYAQALFGAAHGSDSYFPSGTSYSTTASSFALTGGGGLEYNLSPRFALRVVEAQYLHTSLPNGTDNSQNHLMLGAGLVIKFRGRDHRHDVAPEPPPPPAPNKVTALACFAKPEGVKQGQIIEISAQASTLYPKGDLLYSWSSSAGAVQGSGQRITINTAGIAAGDYKVTGHARLSDNSEGSADCEVAFLVLPPPAPVVAPPAVVDDTAAKAEVAFHANVPDALFDYDKWSIRPDTQIAINHAAEYLIGHPTVHVMIGGYSDERGTTEYNIALGLKRANATRDALLAAGVPPDRMEIISYGKSAQICTAENEECWQQNRRAAFSLHQ
jgi:outer membrane protein OmpA-like peptidoglycan-associated protein/opacity protein-like surface antigen